MVGDAFLLRLYLDESEVDLVGEYGSSHHHKRFVEKELYILCLAVVLH